MADDIVERLRSAWCGEVGTDRTRVIQDAAAEIERLRASEAQAIDDADALCEWLRYYDYPSCRFTTVVGAAIKPACMRALDRRAKKEASDDTVKPAQTDTCDT